MTLMQEITQRLSQATTQGHLQPLQFDAHFVAVSDVDFQICLLPSFPSRAAKTSPATTTPVNNPFLPPDPQLTVGKIGSSHHLILNKFPVCERHLVIPRIDYFDQRSACQYEDFLVLTLLLAEHGGLGFYNGGPDAGASQPHFHVQWLPEGQGNPSLQPFFETLTPETDQAIQRHRHWGFEHAFIYVNPSVDPHEYARELYHAYQLICQQLHLKADETGYMPAMNMLIQDGWMLIVPRLHDRLENISLNALSFAGVIYVRKAEYVAQIKQQGIMQLFSQVTLR